MNKKYDVIPVDDYYVVVDGEDVDHGDIAYDVVDKEICTIGCIRYDRLKVIATIGKRIEKLPLIPDEKEQAITDALFDVMASSVYFSRKRALSQLWDKAAATKKVITSVELELVENDDAHGTYQNALEDGMPLDAFPMKIKVDENNVIHPINIFYDNHNNRRMGRR